MDKREIIRDELVYIKFEIEQSAQCKICFTDFVQRETERLILECEKLDDGQFIQKMTDYFRHLHGEIWIEIGKYMSGMIEHGRYIKGIDPPDFRPKAGSLFDVYRRSATFRT